MCALRTLFAALAVLIMTTAGFAASPERRVALVIGNAGYQHFSGLPNPRNDAEDVAAALRRLGFAVVDGPDLTKREMDRKMAEFARLAQDADAALVFYAGHGLQHQGQNYLVPVDAKLKDEIDLDYETIRLEDVLRALDRAKGARILILDACRNLPLAEGKRRSEGLTSQGLAKLVGRKGMIAVYATQPNEVAYDGSGRNSFFTGALVKEMEQPGLEFGQLFQRVSTTVHRATQGRQMPELLWSYPGEFYLNRAESDMQAWERLRGNSDPGSLRAFVTRFPSSDLADAARARLERLEQRIAQEQHEAQEKARRAEEARLALVRREDELRQKAEQERLARLRAEEEARQRAEQARIAQLRADEEARRRQEEERKAAELAARQKAEQEQLAWARLEEEQRRRAQERVARRAEQERMKRLDEERRVADLAARQAAEQEWAKRLEEEAKAAELAARQKAEQERVAKRLEEERKATELAAQKAEQERQVRLQAEEARQRAEQARVAQLRADEDARRRQEEERKAAELAARQKAEQEQLAWARLEEEQRHRAQEQAKAAVASAHPTPPTNEAVAAADLPPPTDAVGGPLLAMADLTETEPALAASVAPFKLPVQPAGAPLPGSAPAAMKPGEPSLPGAGAAGSSVGDEKPTVFASLDQKPQLSAGVGPSELTRQVQEKLRQLGCYSGELEPTWGDKSRSALKKFYDTVGRAPTAMVATRSISSERNLPDAATYDLLRTHQERVCPLICPPGTSPQGEVCIAKSCPRGFKLEDDECVRAKARVAPETPPSREKAAKPRSAPDEDEAEPVRIRRAKAARPRPEPEDEDKPMRARKAPVPAAKEVARPRKAAPAPVREVVQPRKAPLVVREKASPVVKETVAPRKPTVRVVQPTPILRRPTAPMAPVYQPSAPPAASTVTPAEIGAVRAFTRF